MRVRAQALSAGDIILVEDPKYRFVLANPPPPAVFVKILEIHELDKDRWLEFILENGWCFRAAPWESFDKK